VKVLAVDDFAVHLRKYANCYERKPSTIPTDLSLGAPGTHHVGIGYMPIAFEGFGSDSMTWLGQQAVTSDELDGYRASMSDEEIPVGSPQVTVRIDLRKLLDR